MKSCLTLLLFSCVGIFSYGQTCLEKAMSDINVSINIPPFLIASQNETNISVVKDDSIPSIGQSYHLAPAFGSTAFQVFFGLVHSIIRHKNGEYAVFVCVTPGPGREDRFKYVKTDKNKIYTNGEIPFTRIRFDFRYGMPFRSISEKEAFDLDLMVTHCPRERAKELFNADVMVMYPINLNGNVYENKYSVCRAIAVNNDFLSFYLYFMMTGDNYKNFNSYLDDFRHVFWIND